MSLVSFCSNNCNFLNLARYWFYQKAEFIVNLPFEMHLRMGWNVTQNVVNRFLRNHRFVERLVCFGLFKIRWNDQTYIQVQFELELTLQIPKFTLRASQLFRKIIKFVKQFHWIVSSEYQWIQNKVSQLIWYVLSKWS